MLDSSSISIIKKSFEHKTLCECLHKRMDHRLLDHYAEWDYEDADSTPINPLILCHCGCVTFRLMSNLSYLEMLNAKK